MDMQKFKAAYSESRNGANRLFRHPLVRRFIYSGGDTMRSRRYSPSTNWEQGGPLKERERISTDWDSGTWNASSDKTPCYFSAPSELVAVMRAHVYSKLGETAEVPEELA